ncbi:DUF551 domain-containing protein [Enterobacter cloacae]|uniref:DUF551 domain-containing protein n=1 Tax=Enterobacter cloacae TaxID=550 RepID=UPI0020066210|nr:DUF551 domain-containing protein [Enterobacter cloacae]MCK6800713.1 DUF551 domain-containing protein [Enterobacter cloacae]
MSNIDKQWLQQKIAEMEANRDDIPFGLGEDGTNTLAAMKLALASLEAEPVALRDERSGSGGISKKPGFNDLPHGAPLYTDPPAPVSVPDEATPENIEILASTYAPRGVTYQWDSDECNAAADSWNACRAAMLQGAEPVTTAYKLPANTPCKDAPEHIWLQTAGVWPESGEFSELTWCSDNQHQDDTLYIRADVVTGNSPVISDGWVACSDRMPEPKRWLALYGARVFTHGAERGQPYEEPRVDEGYLGSDGQFYLLNWEQPGILDDNYNNDLAVATHWMYWELPAAPQQEVK